MVIIVKKRGTNHTGKGLDPPPKWTIGLGEKSKVEKNLHSWNWIGNLILKLVCFLQLFDLSTPSVVLLHLKKTARANGKTR